MADSLEQRRNARLTAGDSKIIEQRRYRQSVVTKAQGKLSRDRRQWLKDLGFLEDPESQKADAISDLKDAWKASAQGGDS